MNDETNFMQEVAAEDHKRNLARLRQQKKRRSAFSERKVAVQVLLTKAQYLELCQLEREARDPSDFRLHALMQGARFRANTGRGRDKRRAPSPSV